MCTNKYYGFPFANANPRGNLQLFFSYVASTKSLLKIYTIVVKQVFTTEEVILPASECQVVGITYVTQCFFVIFTFKEQLGIQG